MQSAQDVFFPSSTGSCSPIFTFHLARPGTFWTFQIRVKAPKPWKTHGKHMENTWKFRSFGIKHVAFPVVHGCSTSKSFIVASHDPSMPPPKKNITIYLMTCLFCILENQSPGTQFNYLQQTLPPTHLETNHSSLVQQSHNNV